MAKRQILIELETNDDVPESRAVDIRLVNIISRILRTSYAPFVKEWVVDTHYEFFRGKSLYDKQQEEKLKNV